MTDLTQYQDLLIDKKAIMTLAIVKKDNTPHITPVWFNCDINKGIIYFNTAKGRVKANILKKNSKVAMNIIDPNNFYHYLGISGTITDIIEGEDAMKHINLLSKKYTGNDIYQSRMPGEVRIKYICKINQTYPRR